MKSRAATVVVEFDEPRFLSALRAAVAGYFGAVDAWEQAYRSQYRLVAHGQVSADLEPLHANYRAARRELEELIPQATRLCRRYHLREPWNPILLITLGSTPPQSAHWTSAVGQGERTLVRKCLEELETHIAQAAFSNPAGDPPPAARITVNVPRRSGLLGRILDYFL